MSRVISFVLADSNCEPREESGNNKMKILATSGLEPTISLLLDWGSNRLSYHVRSDCRYAYVIDIQYTYANMYSNKFYQKL